MSNTSEKTEQPTPKKKKEARKKGDIAKSKDLNSTVVLWVWIAILWFLAGRWLEMVITLIEKSMHFDNINHQLIALSQLAFYTLVAISASFLVPLGVFSLLTEFIQVGTCLTIEKIKPDFNRLNPADGLSKLFSMDNMVELLKTIIKTAVIIALGIAIIQYHKSDFLALYQNSPLVIMNLLSGLLLQYLLITSLVFIAISIADYAYQRFSHTKKLRMSKHDIKQEHKNSEGDPKLNAKRKQLMRQWAQEGVRSRTSQSAVLIVNPTHIAIALGYDKDTQPVPIINAKGQADSAQLMRSIAEEEGIPVLRNITLARALLSNSEEGDIIPEEYFDIIAEVVVWATRAKDRLQKGAIEQACVELPGEEDLTCY